jgi:hypothetical protein
MSEQSPLTQEKFEILKAPEHEALPTAAEAEPLRPGEADPLKQLESARSEVESVSTEQNKAQEALDEAEKPADAPAPQIVTRESKKAGLRQELKRLQRQEKLPARTLSKVVHQPVIRAASEVAGKSLTRPSGLLGGGLVAFLGTASYVYFTRHIGLQYNYFIFIALFIGGFAIGLVLELVVWALSARKRSS